MHAFNIRWLNYDIQNKLILPFLAKNLLSWLYLLQFTFLILRHQVAIAFNFSLYMLLICIEGITIDILEMKNYRYDEIFGTISKKKTQSFWITESEFL